MNLLFVCTGNTCRSPMAQMLAAALFPAANIRSAGLFAAGGAPASVQAQAVMTERGLDLSTHQAQPVTAELLAAADLVITMTAAHKRLLLENFPAAAAKTQTLGELAGTNADVQDPYGGSVESYRRTAQQIEEMLRALHLS